MDTQHHGVCAIWSLPAQSGICRHLRTLPRTITVRGCRQNPVCARRLWIAQTPRTLKSLGFMLSALSLLVAPEVVIPTNSVLPVTAGLASWRLLVFSKYALLQVLAYPFWGNPLVTGVFHSQRASYVDRWCFFDVNPTKLFNKDLNGRWSETPWRSRDVIIMKASWFISPVAWSWPIHMRQVFCSYRGHCVYSIWISRYTRKYATITHVRCSIYMMYLHKASRVASLITLTS